MRMLPSSISIGASNARSTFSATSRTARLPFQAEGHDHELVAAEPGDQVLGADRGPQPLTEGPQQLVAGLVAHAVVDRLEAVEVEEEHADDPVVAIGAAKGDVESRPEFVSRQQSGELVVRGPVFHLPQSGVRLATRHPLERGRRRHHDGDRDPGHQRHAAPVEHEVAAMADPAGSTPTVSVRPSAPGSIADSAKRCTSERPARRRWRNFTPDRIGTPRTPSEAGSARSGRSTHDLEAKPDTTAQ